MIFEKRDPSVYDVFRGISNIGKAKKQRANLESIEVRPSRLNKTHECTKEQNNMLHGRMTNIFL
jgi:hypothetical protein